MPKRDPFTFSAKPILIISCVVLLFVLGIQNKETKDTFEILAYNQTYNSITTQATPMDYYLIHDQVNIMDKVQLKKKYEEKYFAYTCCIYNI